MTGARLALRVAPGELLMAVAVDPKLAAALKLARSATQEAPLLFAMVPKGTNDGALIVSKTKIGPGDITQAKNKCGGTTVLSGRCFMEEGKFVFEMGREPPRTMAKALKEILGRDGGMTSTPLARLAPDMVEQAPTSPEAALAGASPEQATSEVSAGTPPPTQETAPGLAAWQAERVRAVNAIRRIATVVAKTKDVQAGQ